MKESHTAMPVRPQSAAFEMSRHSDAVWIFGGTFREEASAGNDGRRSRQAARHPEPVNTSISHVGFTQPGATP
jgi:hypothetical protein